MSIAKTRLKTLSLLKVKTCLPCVQWIQTINWWQLRHTFSKWWPCCGCIALWKAIVLIMNSSWLSAFWQQNQKWFTMSFIQADLPDVIPACEQITKSISNYLCCIFPSYVKLLKYVITMNIVMATCFYSYRMKFLGQIFGCMPDIQWMDYTVIHVSPFHCIWNKKTHRHTIT